MTQLAADEAAAVGGDPVDNTTDAPEAVEYQPEETTEGSMYPDDTPEPEGGEGDQPDDQGDDEPAEPAIDAPNSWKAEDKARWANIPREAQEIIARREAEFARGITDKAKEVERVKTETVSQAAQELATFRETQARSFEVLAAQVMPQQPDERLLYSQDPQDHVLYNQQRAMFERAYAQQQQLQQAAQYERSEAQRIQQDLEAQAKAADDAKLREVLPEWFDESDTGKRLQTELKSIADEIGYSELWDQRNAADVLALRKIAEWKKDAARWQSYDRNRRNPNGQYKAQRQLPPVTKPGVPVRGGQRPATDDPVKLLYPND